MKKLNSPRLTAIYELSDESLLTVLKATPNKVLRDSLNRAPRAITELVKMVLSPRAAQLLQEDVNVFPISTEAAAGAQEELIAIIEEVVRKTGYAFAPRSIKRKRSAVQRLFSEIAAGVTAAGKETGQDLLLAFKEVTHWALMKRKYSDEEAATRHIAREYLKCALADESVPISEREMVADMLAALEKIARDPLRAA